MTVEQTQHVQLNKANGQLNEASIGWSRQPIVACNVRGRFPRKKKWNYWCVTSPDVLFSATISHIDYAAVMFVYVLDLKTLRFYEQTQLVPLGKGVSMPDNVRESVTYKSKQMEIRMTEEEDQTTLAVVCPNFNGELLKATLLLDRPSQLESLNVVVPWSAKHFQFTSKQPAIPVRGTISWGSKQYEMSPGSAFACLDFGRGVWPYSSTWNWASASGS